jgi:hypothetical protein
VVTRQFPRALSSLRVRTNIFHQKILAKGCGESDSEKNGESFF